MPQPTLEVSLCSFALACSHCGATDQHLRVYTFDSAGVLADLRFYITVHCP